MDTTTVFLPCPSGEGEYGETHYKFMSWDTEQGYWIVQITGLKPIRGYEITQQASSIGELRIQVEDKDTEVLVLLLGSGNYSAIAEFLYDKKVEFSFSFYNKE